MITVKNVRTRRRQKPDEMVMETMMNVLDAIVRALGSERVLSKGGGGTVRY